MIGNHDLTLPAMSRRCESVSCAERAIVGRQTAARISGILHLVLTTEAPSPIGIGARLPLAQARDVRQSIAGDLKVMLYTRRLMPHAPASTNRPGAGPALPGPCGRHIRYSRPHIDGCHRAPAPARGWKARPGSGGHG